LYQSLKAQLERERREKEQKEAEINEIQQQLRQMKTAQNRSKYRSYQYGDTFNSQRTTKQDIYSLQRDQDRYIEEQRKKQVELEELTKQQEERNRQEQRKMERFYNEQSNEVSLRFFLFRSFLISIILLLSVFSASSNISLV
jgi:colicin import membrane protein